MTRFWDQEKFLEGKVWGQVHLLARGKSRWRWKLEGQVGLKEEDMSLRKEGDSDGSELTS